MLTFCLIIMSAGRPRKADAGSLYAFAHQFYWDFRRLAEGHYRWRTDEKEYKGLVNNLESKAVQLSQEQIPHLARCVEEEIRAGRLKEADKETRLRDLEASQLSVTRDWLHRRAAEKARKQLRVPGEPDVLKALLHARRPERVRAICEDAFVPRTIQINPGITRQITMPNWPIPTGSVLPFNLSQYALAFIAAKKDRRFPKSTQRPSSRLKQLWFLSRALAGALFGVTTRTAINLVGSKRPEQVFQESRAAKPSRKQKKRSRKS